MALMLRKSPIYLVALGLLLSAMTSVPASAQQPQTLAGFLESPKPSSTRPPVSSTAVTAPQQGHNAPTSLHCVLCARAAGVSTPFAKPVQANYLTTIDRMEAAFYLNDTPFVDQVRFPLASLWHGRVKLVGFESDVTTANFVLGLPGGGTLPSLGMFSSGHLATHAPPSDQLTGVHLTFNLRGSEATALDNSGLHGLQYVMRASRGFFQSVTGR
jgi:hypothetical protein